MDKRGINHLINDLDLLESLSKAYATISSERMKKVRGEVISSRDFLLSLGEIFREVRASFKRDIKKLGKKSKTGSITFIPHNGKTASVLLSANTGLYGDIVPKTFRMFAEEIRRSGTEAAIVGKLGLSYFLSEFDDAPYSYFDFPDYGTSRENFAKLIAHLVQYDEIHIFYGKFKSLIHQEPEMYNISAQNPLAETGNLNEKNLPKYLFEPSIEDLLVFFETEMFGSLFEQAISEGQLAKFASRMMSMDKASQRVKDELKKAKILKLKLLHSESNKKIINTFASLSLWR